MTEKVQEVSVNPPMDPQVDHGLPPYTCSPGWIDRLLEAVRDLNPDQITREFVSANVVGSRHEGKVLNASRFLSLIDEKGNVTPRLRALRVVGPEFTANLAIVVRHAYSDLLSTVSIRSTSHDRLINFLMQKYSLGQSQAESALRFFIHLASRAGMELNDEISRPPGTKHGPEARKEQYSKIGPPRRQPAQLKGQEHDSGALATIDGSFGRIRIIDQSTLELARNVLDSIEQRLKTKNQVRDVTA